DPQLFPFGMNDITTAGLLPGTANEQVIPPERDVRVPVRHRPALRSDNARSHTAATLARAERNSTRRSPMNQLTNKPATFTAHRTVRPAIAQVLINTLTSVLARLGLLRDDAEYHLLRASMVIIFFWLILRTPLRDERVGSGFEGCVRWTQRRLRLGLAGLGFWIRRNAQRRSGNWRWPKRTIRSTLRLTLSMLRCCLMRLLLRL